MSVDVRPQVRVRRPCREVAAFMFDPRNDLRWTGGITASRPAQPGPLVPGAGVERTARFLGRSFTYGYVVTAHEPDSLLELRVDRPFSMLIRYELADDDGGTLAAIHATGSPGRVFGWATPLMRRQVRRSIAADLRRLRDFLVFVESYGRVAVEGSAMSGGRSSGPRRTAPRSSTSRSA